MKQLRQYIRGMLLEAPQDYFEMQGIHPEEYELDPTSREQPGKKKSGKTVGEALEEIKAKEVTSKDAQRQGMLKKLGWEFPKMVPVLGAIPMLIDFLNDEHRIASDTAPSSIEGILRDYPLLDTWNINHNLFKVIDNKLLEEWEDEYMIEEVANVKPETLISQLTNINVYIARKIAKLTNGEIIVEIAE